MVANWWNRNRVDIIDTVRDFGDYFVGLLLAIVGGLVIWAIIVVGSYENAVLGFGLLPTWFLLGLGGFLFMYGFIIGLDAIMRGPRP